MGSHCQHHSRIHRNAPEKDVADALRGFANIALSPIHQYGQAHDKPYTGNNAPLPSDPPHMYKILHSIAAKRQINRISTTLI